MAKIEKLAEQQLEAAGLSNYTNRGGSSRRTRKTDPKALEAEAAAKKYNIPLPGKTGPANAGMEAQIRRMQEQFRQMGANGVIRQNGGTGGVMVNGKQRSTVTPSPRGTGAMVNNLINVGRQVDPLSTRGERIFHRDSKGEADKLKKLLGR